MRSLPILALLVVLSSCVGPPTPAPRPIPRPVPVQTPAPMPTPVPLGSDWRDWPVTPGDWTYRQDARGSIALYGVPGADAVLSLRCDRDAGAVYLARAGTATGAVPITIRTSTVMRTLNTTQTNGTPAWLAAPLAPRDSLLDAMGFSRGRFVVQQAGFPTLVVPAWPEILRVTEDCRR
ncbi:hypothetical protein G4G27_11530 [Sphingomonas sp. So64.6b]|uniref:hypothetical protein n=1 Tax=Sphingomonas sp. So64.6b TaxID=2997354 RepID=UPI001602FF6A|nr:hypothetical protein [Sphingomonas sp. So64.6b]QNA84551.1 hypothetical protein G4G27_11530 [Sphingomonas sp. So64.6b]